MALLPVLPNFYYFGENGSHETLPQFWTADVWNYIQTAFYDITQSQEQVFEGSYSAKSVSKGVDPGGYNYRIFVEANHLSNPTLTSGKKYIIRFKVLVPSVNPIASNGAKIKIECKNVYNTEYLTLTQTDLTIASAMLDTWQEVNFSFEAKANVRFNFDFYVTTLEQWGAYGEIDYSGGTIYFDNVELLELIEEDDINIDTVFGRNPIPIVATKSNLSSYHTNTRFLVDLFLRSETKDDFEKLISYRGNPGLNGTTFIANLQRPLFSVLSPDLPSVNQAQITTSENSIKRFYAAITEERFGVWGWTKFQTTRSEIMDVLQGGLSFIDWPDNVFFTDNVANQGQFLTWAPNNKQVDQEGPEYLYYMTNKQDFDTAYLHCKVTYEDGSVETITPFTKAAAGNKILIIPVGFTALGLHNLEGGIIKKYTVWISKSSNPATISGKSQERTFVVDYSYHKSTRYFLYQNSLGAMEVLRCVGKFETGIDLNRQEGTKILSAQYSASDASNFWYNSSYQTPIKGNTGFISQAWKEHLTEFIISENTFELVKGKLIKIRMTKDKSELVKDREYLNALTFDYTYSHQNPAYSKL